MSRKWFSFYGKSPELSFNFHKCPGKEKVTKVWGYKQRNKDTPTVFEANSKIGESLPKEEPKSYKLRTRRFLHRYRSSRFRNLLCSIPLLQPPKEEVIFPLTGLSFLIPFLRVRPLTKTSTQPIFHPPTICSWIRGISFLSVVDCSPISSTIVLLHSYALLNLSFLLWLLVVRIFTLLHIASSSDHLTVRSMY